MQDKLRKLEELFEEKQTQLADPAVYADPALMKWLTMLVLYCCLPLRDLIMR